MDELSARGSRNVRGKPARIAIAREAPDRSIDDKKSRAELIEELAGLRRQLGANDASGRQATEGGLKASEQRVQHLLAVTPAIIYTNKASGNFPCTFVSENLKAIMGYSPSEMIGDQKCWSDHLHPEDAPRVFAEMRPLIAQGGGTIEYRFQHHDGHFIWIQDSFKVVKDPDGTPVELVGAWADITARKSIEAELSDTRRRLQYLLAVSRPNPGPIGTFPYQCTKSNKGRDPIRITRTMRDWWGPGRSAGPLPTHPRGVATTSFALHTEATRRGKSQ